MTVLYRQDAYPIFQNRVYDSAAEAINCERGDIELVEDQGSGLVHNRLFDPGLMVYDSRYQNEQAVSPQFQAHLQAVAGLIGAHMGRDRLVEVGCGKAWFLELLLAAGFDVTGFDPTYEGANPRVQRRYFAPGVMAPGRGLILRHVLEHVEDPVRFLQGLRDANNGSGRIYIEVPCFDWICERRAWFDICYEHVNYFRLSDFRRMFGEIHSCGHLFGGQYLHVIAELSSLSVPRADAGDRARFPADFTRGITGFAIADNAVVWGGSTKGVIFAFLKARANSPVAMVIDINPAKQGKFLAATGLQVESPRGALAKLPRGSTIYVMNSNYLEEIRKMTNHEFECVGVDQ